MLNLGWQNRLKIDFRKSEWVKESLKAGRAGKNNLINVLYYNKL
jgi:hypothetical protein